MLCGGVNQEISVNTIIALVGEYTPIDSANRILNSYQKLQVCVRHKEEKPFKLADSFCGLSLEYMTLARISAEVKDSHMIAIVHFHNANTDENTSNAITKQFASKAKSRKVSASSGENAQIKIQCP